MNVVSVILCGGEGRRLYPLSTPTTPKVFLPLISHRTILQETVARVRELGDVYVTGSTKHQSLIQKQLPFLPESHLFCEPVAWGTALAVLWTAFQLSGKISEESVLLIMPADQYVEDQRSFATSIEYAANRAQSGNWILLGTKPSRFDSELGYIGKKQASYAIEQFIEKPTSKEVLSLDLLWLWNTGIFLVQLRRVIEDFMALQPLLFAMIKDQICWEQLKNQPSLDKAILEVTPYRECIPVTFGWKDIGNWKRILELQDHHSS